MENQLLNRYLNKKSYTHGIYLVGWYQCKQWDKEDYRNKDTPFTTIEEAKDFFNKQADKLSFDSNKKIQANVLNCALRQKS